MTTPAHSPFPVDVVSAASGWEIAAAIGTIAAAVVAAAIAVLDIPARRRAEADRWRAEEERRRAEMERDVLLERQRRAQAARVTARLMTVPAPQGHVFGEHTVVEVYNASDLPIHSVAFEVWVRDDTSGDQIFGTEHAAVIPPGERHTARLSAEPPNPPPAGMLIEAAATFMDAENNWWRRMDNGLLLPYDPDVDVFPPPMPRGRR